MRNTDHRSVIYFVRKTKEAALTQTRPFNLQLLMLFKETELTITILQKGAANLSNRNFAVVIN